MSRISQFHGIRISMYPRDHAPPHFHAMYQGFEARISIASGEILDGRLPPSRRKLVMEWWRRYKSHLERDWTRAAAGLDPLPIPPLE